LRVLVMSGDSLLVGSLTDACRADGRTELAATVGSAEAAFQAIQCEPFDLALIDFDLPILESIGAVQMIASAGTHTEVMVVLSMANIGGVLSAVQAGANSVLTKERTNSQEVVQALVRLCAGESSISPEIARHLIERYQRTH
tara:strand:+ start:283 stop:708 length:426 start_codon:yes stop_codon:yes gene_type:complete